MTTKVPAEPIHQALQAYLETHEETQPEFAERSGVALSTIFNLVGTKTRRQTIEFCIADAILCAIGKPMLWYSPELHDAYFAVDLERAPTLDVLRRLRISKDSPVCVNGHDRTPENTRYKNTSRGRKPLCRICDNETSARYQARKKADAERQAA